VEAAAGFDFGAHGLGSIGGDLMMDRAFDVERPQRFLPVGTWNYPDLAGLS
jgi:hypothetical protein